ncbi:Panacea domain-containing protein [Mesorhizobium sp. Root172]|uniref:Panacea domain-containing protein n=1 Tax=Mesorhizobium sp. Root172 TaxID=1736481 RepID=UPI0006F31358|nr:Panacea domain-containing protein [Mesorhizobium sp. Root172]KRB26296.1 hypothetical protein ASE05_10330 [Mesorhizobium sp. Root172]
MALNFRPNYEKIVELMLYLAHKKPGADKYQAVKFFYLADKAHLERYGRPITQDKYVALDYGPVASSVKDFMERDRFTMRRAHIADLPFDIEEHQRGGKTSLVKLGKPHRDVDLELFSKSDLRIFDEILQKYGDCTFDDLYKITHKHFAYKRAWSEKPRGAKSAPMNYDEMIESPERRKIIVEDIGPVSKFV